MLTAKFHNKLKIAIWQLSTGKNQGPIIKLFGSEQNNLRPSIRDSYSFYKECVLELHEKATMYF